MDMEVNSLYAYNSMFTPPISAALLSSVSRSCADLFEMSEARTGTTRDAAAPAPAVLVSTSVNCRFITSKVGEEPASARFRKGSARGPRKLR